MKRQRSTYNLRFRSVISTIAGRPCTRLAAAVNPSNRGMLTPLLTLSFLFSALSGVTRADQYWVTWEGSDYPENEGWQRRINGEGPAFRSLSDGVMTIDGRWSTQVDDFYRMNRSFNPGPGEVFVMQWRVRVNEVIGHPLFLYDPDVSIYSDDDWGLKLTMGVDRIRSLYEEESVVAPFEPHVFHAFEVRTLDMRTYALTIDGAPAFTGNFWEPGFTRSEINWGDGTRGSASSSDWDYFRFGVVPQPSTSVLMLALLYGARATRQSRRMT